jgi:putative flippase GtrA
LITKQFVRYAAVGVVHNLSGYLLYLLATYLGAEPKLTMSVLFFLGVALSFLLNRSWTFQHSGYAARSLWRFVVVYLGGYALNLLALMWFHDRLGYAHQWVQGCAIVVIALLMFLLNRYFVFRASDTARNT